MKISKGFKLSIVLLLGLSLLGGLTGCSSKKTESKAVNVRVGYFPNITQSQALVGREQGTFQKAVGAANADILTLLQKGAIDGELVPEPWGSRLIKVTNNPEKDSVLDFVKSSVKEGFLKTEPDTKDLFNLTILNKVLKDKGIAQIQ